MKILITTLNSKFIHSSLSIRYLKSYCDDLNFDIKINEFTINQNNDFITAQIYKSNPDIVAFSCYIWNIEATLDICERLKLVNPNIKILLGGPEVSYDGEKILNKYKYVDYIVYGEGEETFREFLLNLNNNLDNIDGLIYRENNKIVNNGPRIAISNLDNIPSPFSDDLNEYKDKIIYYESSRGCPFNCQFCLSSTMKGVRFFSIERVKQDLKKLIDAKVKQVKFVDRTFNANKKYAQEIMNFIMDQDTNETNFHFEVTAHLLDDDMLDFLSKAKEGLFQFEIGVQSTNQKTLMAIERNTNFDRLSEVVKKIQSYKNIHQHLDLIAALPYENYESFKNSFNDVYNLRPEKLQLGFLKLLKGSRLRDDLDKYGYKFINKPPYEVLENNYISYEEILKLKSLEEIVERYGNETDFRASIEYLLKNHYNSPFDLFMDIADYWEKNDYHKVSNSKKTLYKILYDFYINRINENKYTFNELIKYDYIYNNKGSIPDFIERFDVNNINKKRHDFLKEDKNIEKYLSNLNHLNPKKIINEVQFEKFKFNVLEFINSNFTETSKIESVHLFEYNNNKLAFNKCKVYDVTKEFSILEE